MLAMWLLAAAFVILVLSIAFILACWILLALGMSLEDLVKHRQQGSHGHHRALHHP